MALVVAMHEFNSWQWIPLGSLKVPATGEPVGLLAHLLSFFCLCRVFTFALHVESQRFDETDHLYDHQTKA